MNNPPRPLTNSGHQAFAAVAFGAIIGAASLFAPQAQAQAQASDVIFTIDQSLVAGGQNIPYAIEVRLTDTAPTRVGFDVVAELNHLQAALPRILALDLDDTCRAHLSLAMTEIRATDDAISLSGAIAAQLFECQPLNAARQDRGASIYDQTLTLAITTSATIRDECVFLRVDAADVEPAHQREGKQQDHEAEALEKARELVATVADVLAKIPICPKLPPELDALDAQFDEGGTREVGDGELTAFMTGEIDVSTSSIIALLIALQARGVLPPQP